MSIKKILNEAQIQWAYEKYCEGYSQGEIAKALFVCTRTVIRAINGRPRVKPELKYDWSDE